MELKFQPLDGYLRAEIARRVTLAEARHAVHAIIRETVAWLRMHAIADVLHHARAVRGLRVALVADSWELYTSHQEVMVLARHRGIQIESFRDEAAAVKWLKAARKPAMAAG
jgi:Arc/MetJ family transcription regulator